VIRAQGGEFAEGTEGRSTMERQVVVVSPNLGLDRIGNLARLEPGTVMRFRSVLASAGGKGLNLARAAAALGVRTTAVGVLGGWIGRLVAELASREGLHLQPLWVDAETRVNLIVLEDSGQVTVFNEEGAVLAPEAGERLLELVAAGLDHAGLLVAIGSLPPGLPPSLYAACVRLGRERGLPVVVDAARAALEAVLGTGPDIVVPNVFEAEGVLGRVTEERVTDDPEELRRRALAAARELAPLTRVAAIVKASAAGAAVATRERAWFVPAPPAAVRNPIGAGDAFVAGLVAGLVRGWTLENAVQLAVAAGSASVETLQPGALVPARVDELLRGMVGGP